MRKFSKYHGLGNDFILVDCQKNDASGIEHWKNWAVSASKRGHGIGADGVLLATRNEEDGHLEMTVINADGSEPEMCGNGLRCFVHFAVEELGERQSTFPIHTGAGLLEASWEKDNKDGGFLVTVNMGQPIFEASQIPASQVVNPTTQSLAGDEVEVHAVGMGNPHGVIFLESEASATWMKEKALALEASGTFPEGVNTGFVTILNGSMSLVVHERGCGFTEACGTGACAAVVAAIQNKLLPQDEWVDVQLPGGTLGIRWSGPGAPVWMKGPSAFVYAGHAPVE